MAYPTTTSYERAINKESRITFIDGEIKGSNGVVTRLSNEMLVTGGFYITNQCSNTEAFEFGSVFTAELGITLKTEIDRYTLFGAEIKPYFNIMLSEGTYERIPLGVYYVNEPTRTGKNITLKAYDKMINFEDELFESITGTPYELFTYCCARCDVEFSQTREQIEMMANGTILLNVTTEMVSTYRDLISYICQITCSFATIDREGRLKIVEYQTEPSKEISAKTRTASKFSDFETYFSNVKGSFIHNDNTKSYMQSNGESGLTYDMGEVPIVQGLDDTNQAIVSNALLRLSPLRYTPCELTFSGDPSIDLGDMVLTHDKNGNEVKFLVTFYKWTYRGGHQIKSAGQNPRLLKLKDRVSQQMVGLKSSISSKDIEVYTYTNASRLDIQGGNPEEVTSMNSIATISFAVKKASTCMVMVTIPLRADVETDVEFHQLFDGVEMLGSTISQRCHKGASTITFANYFNTSSNSIQRYSIVGITKGIDEGESGLVSIEPYNMKVMMFGQGLSSVVQWDGNVIIDDSIGVITIAGDNIEVSTLSEEVTSSHTLRNPNSNVDRVRVITIDTSEIELVGFDSESVTIS